MSLDQDQNARDIPAIIILFISVVKNGDQHANNCGKQCNKVRKANEHARNDFIIRTIQEFMINIK